MEATSFEERKLDLDAPLISVRRPSRPSTSIANYDQLNSMRLPPINTSRRVPFEWESSPGVPKKWAMRGLDSRVKDGFMSMTQTIKPPPSRWRSNSHGFFSDGGDRRVHRWSKGSHDSFSDALDEFSLCESLGNNRRVHRPPSFILDRFLSSANALADASASGNPRYTRPRVPRDHSRRLQIRPINEPHPGAHRRTNNDSSPQVHSMNHMSKIRSRSPTKGCGLSPFLPWSLKCSLGGLKSPVVRSQALRGNRVVDTQLTKRWLDDGLSSEDDKMSIKACKSPGWGLQFLDTSRLKTKWRDCYGGKSNKEFMDDKGGRTMWSLPQLKSPSDPWLSNVLNSIHK